MMSLLRQYHKLEIASLNTICQLASSFLRPICSSKFKSAQLPSPNTLVNLHLFGLTNCLHTFQGSLQSLRARIIDSHLPTSHWAQGLSAQCLEYKSSVVGNLLCVTNHSSKQNLIGPLEFQMLFYFLSSRSGLSSTLLLFFILYQQLNRVVS